MYKHNEVRWEPLGVIAACVSWKYVSHLGENASQIIQTTDLTQLPCKTQSAVLPAD